MPKIYCIILKHFWHFLSEKPEPTTNLQSTITFDSATSGRYFLAAYLFYKILENYP